MEKDKIMDQKPDIMVGITHNGKFHCDDVCCAALLRIIYSDIQIVRQSTIDCDPDNIKNTIVFDIGNGKYDHHDTPEYRPNGVQYASFGKMFRDFAKYIPISKSVETFMDESFVQEIDKMDNGVGFSLFGAALSSYNVNWDGDLDKQDERFFEAVKIAQEVMINMIEKRVSNLRADQYINKAIETQNSPILILDKSMPIHNRLSDNILFIISPSNRDSYNLQPVKNAEGKWRRCLPIREWREETAPDGLIYINGNIATFDTVYNAINAAELALKNNNIGKFPVHIIKAVQSEKYKVYKSKDSSEQITIDGFDILSNNKICAFRENAAFYTLNPLEMDASGKVYIDPGITFGIVDNRDKSDYTTSAKEFNKNSKNIKITQRSLPNGNRFDIA